MALVLVGRQFLRRWQLGSGLLAAGWLAGWLSVFLLSGFESLGIEKNMYRIAASRESKLIDFVEGIER